MRTNIHTDYSILCICARQDCHLERVTLTWKPSAINRCVFTWRTFLPHFTQIRLETMEP